jgi:hypothetical protein
MYKILFIYLFIYLLLNYLLTQHPNNMVTKTSQVKGTTNKTNETNVKAGPKI